MNSLLQWVIPAALVTCLLVGVMLSVLDKDPDRAEFIEAHRALEEAVGSPAIALARAMSEDEE